ncbi:Uncharacterized protein SCF082_LOCUS52360, partial [Durusdinium trenchii]
MGCVRWALLALAASADGWWWNATGPAVPADENTSVPPWTERVFKQGFPNLAGWWEDGGPRMAGLRQWTIDLGEQSTDRGIWTLFDLLFSLVGWMLFGSAWSGVKVGCRRALQLLLAIVVCIVAHYVWALCWPVLSLMLTTGMACAWLVRKLVRIMGNIVYRGQRLLGGTPEAGDADFYGPGMGRTPETAELRHFKPNNTVEKWVVLKRDGMVAVFRLSGETFPIRSSGLYAGIDVDSLRGNPRLVSLLRGHDKVHLCRHSTCGEDGQHFQVYGLAKKFDPEKFQLQQACQSAKDAGTFLWGMASATTKRLADYGSESEPEAEKCGAHRVRWTGVGGEDRLSLQVCTQASHRDVELLEEDKFDSRGSVPLCAQHMSGYLLNRFANKCAYDGCTKFGNTIRKGVRFCGDHEEEGRSSRSSRSRSRERPREPQEPDGPAVRARPEPRGEEGLGEVRELLKEIKGSLGAAEVETPAVTPPRKVTMSRSPGRTPKSSIHRNLARIGMLDSPDDVHMGNLLEEFFDLYAETRDTNMTEADVRSRLADRHQKRVQDITRSLVQLALVEQDKGQKGLTKFIKTWSKTYEPPDIGEFPSSASEWSVVPSLSSNRTSPAQETVNPVIIEKSTPPVVIEKPSIFGQDRKAGAGASGAGEGDPMLQVAKALQNQTQEIAALVRGQHEANNLPVGTLKGAGDHDFGLIRRHSSLASLAAVAGGQEPTTVCRTIRPAGDHPGLLFRELFAGKATLTAAWRQHGTALEPVECFQDPHNRQGYMAEHDLLIPEVRSFHLARAAGVYCPDFVATIVNVVMATVKGGGQLSPRDLWPGKAGGDQEGTTEAREEQQHAPTEEDFFTAEGQEGAIRAPQHTEVEVEPVEAEVLPNEAEVEEQQDVLSEGDLFIEENQEETIMENSVDEEQRSESQSSGEHTASSDLMNDADAGDLQEELQGVWRDYAPPIDLDPARRAGAALPLNEAGFVQDQCEVSTQQGQVTIYHHIPRTEFFVPGGIGFPCDLDQLRNERTTRCMGVYQDGQTFSIEWMDNWRIEGATNPELPPWTGYTIFTLQGRALDGVDHVEEMEGGSSSEGTEAEGSDLLEDLEEEDMAEDVGLPEGEGQHRGRAGGSEEAMHVGADEETINRVPTSVSVPWASFKILEVSPNDRLVRDFEHVGEQCGATINPADKAELVIVAATLGVDTKGYLAGKVVQCGLQADMIIVEGPMISSWHLFDDREDLRTWGRWEGEFVTTEFGETMARRRKVLMLAKGIASEQLGEVENYLIKTPVASPMSSCLQPADAKGLIWEYPQRVQVCPGIPRDPLLPVVAAHGWWQVDDPRLNIYGTGGPARWPLQIPDKEEVERVYVYDLKGPVGAVRALLPMELWRCQGRDLQQWELVMAQENDERKVVMHGCRGTGLRTAQALLFAAAKILTKELAQQGTRAGAVRDGPEDESLARLLVWLRKWRLGEFGRGLASRKAGGADSMEETTSSSSRTVWRWGESLWQDALEELEMRAAEDGRAGGRKNAKKADQSLGNSRLDDSRERKLPFDGA